nr:YSC84-related protein [uncultured Flavobacterium sp.]
MKSIFDNAYGYVIFPNVGKGGIGVGAAAGNGAVYEKNKLIGMAKLSQLSIGFQAGGQAYREVIFFESKSAMDRFKESKFEFAAQVSAVAAKAGASGNAKYTDGVMVFTMQKGGLMYEASVGGQKFKYTKS